MEFQVGDKVLLKIYPWKGLLDLVKRGKLSPRYVGPFKIKPRIGQVAYRLELLQGIHDTFDVLNLIKCLIDESTMVELDDVTMDDKFSVTKKSQLR